MSEIIEIGDVRAEKGMKKSGVLRVGENPVRSLDLPITVINGSGSGAILAITAGSHGCEYAGIEAAIRISNRVEPKELNGALIIVHIVNVPSFQTRTPWVCSIDNVDINRVYPGKLDGSIANIIAYKIFNEVVKKSDYSIDLHGGDLGESLYPFIIFERTGNEEVDDKSERLARAYGLEYICDGWRGPTSLFYEAARQGIPAIIAEAGEEGRIEERYVDLHCNGIINVMRHLKMVEGTPSRSVVPRTIYRGKLFYSKRGGLFYPNVQVGRNLSKGDVVGEIRNIRGEVLEKIISPMSGIAMSIMTNPVVNSGDYIWMICKLEKK